MGSRFVWRTALGLLVFLSPLVSQAEWHQASKDIMGTRITVEIFQPDAIKASDALNAVFAEMHRIDALMSPFKPDSLLSQINRDAYQQAVALTDELYALITQSLQFSALTKGAFDISFASAGFLYDYRNNIKPDAKTLKASLNKINYKNIHLNKEKKSLKFSRPGVKIDLGGIAKGHAVDQSIHILQSLGIKQALVTAGGDSRVLGDRQGDAWKIGIRDPRKRNTVTALIPLADTAISTSGDYERYFEEDGIRYHHILNPKTGDSARELQSVTIIGPDATTTDALSTSVFVLGKQAGLALVNRLPGIDAILIDNKGQLLYSNELESLTEQ
ncbi:MAG: FAD:protein FMN transferase [Gammaproteobacteria bacterium]